MNYIFLYLLTLPVFFGIDFLWLSQAVPRIYQKEIGHLLAEKPQLVPAALFYAAFIVGILYFAAIPGLKVQSWQLAALNGALFGFFTYATYDLTNFATMKNWPLSITVIDIIWGTVLCMVVSVAAYFIGSTFLKIS